MMDPQAHQTAPRRETRQTGLALDDRGCSHDLALVPNARVEVAVDHVDEQIGENHDEADHQDDGLYDRVITTVNRVDQQSPDTRYAKDRFGNDGSGHHIPEQDAQDGHDREHGVLQGVLQNYLPLPQPLGAGAGDVGQPQNLKEAGSRLPHDDRRQPDAQGHRRQYGVSQALHGIVAPGHITRRGEPLQAQSEDVDQPATE